MLPLTLAVLNALVLGVLVRALREWRRVQREIDNNIRLVSERQAEFAVLLNAESALAQKRDAECRKQVADLALEIIGGARRALAAELASSLATATAQIETRVSTIAVEMRAELENDSDAVQMRLHQLQSAHLQAIDEIKARLPQPERPYEDPMPSIESLSEAQLLDLAQALTTLRPLVTYPNWQFDADWRNSEMAFRMRRSVWTYFHQRQTPGPIDVPWYHGMKLRLYLGNDVSRQIFIGGCIDPNEFALFDKLLKPGMVLMDVGANEGIYSVFASARIGVDGTIWAVEPSPREMQRVTANLQLNGLTNVRTLSVALADEDAEARLLVAGLEHGGHNTLGAFVYETALEREMIVPMRRLDTVVEENGIERLDFIKVDVEGAELRVFAGGRETLSRFRPLVLFEMNGPSLKNQSATPEALLAFFASLDYRIYLIEPSTGLPVPAFEGRYSENMLAVPAERELPAGVFLPAPMAVV